MGYIGKVPADVLIDPMVDSAAITDATIVTADLANDAVTAAKLAADSVDSSELVDGSVDNSHLAGSIAMNKTNLTAGTGLTLSTDTLSVDAAQTGITSVGTLSSLTLGGDLLAPEYIKHVGDTDTHLRFSADDAIEITAGNVKFMRFLEDDTQDMLVINEDSADIDFRIESNDDANMFFVDGGTNQVGIGTNDPNTKIVRNFSANHGLVISHADQACLQLDETGETNSYTSLVQADTHLYCYNNGAGNLKFYTNGNLELEVSDSASVFSGDIKNSSDSKALYVGAGDDLKIHHNGTDSYIQGTEGHLFIHNNKASKDLILLQEGASGGIEFRTNNSVVGRWNHSGKLRIGASESDAMLRIRQDSSQTAPGTNDGTCLYLTGYNANDKYGGGIGWNWNDCGTGVHPTCWIGTHSQSYAAYTKADLVFATRDATTNDAATERMRITAAGNVTTSKGSALAYEAGTDHMVAQDLIEYTVNGNSGNANYKRMKTFTAARGGTIRVTWWAKNTSGSHWWAYRWAKNNSSADMATPSNTMQLLDGSTAAASYSYNLHSSNTNSVHNYRRFDLSLKDVVIGDVIELWMVNSDGSGNPASSSQTLWAKDLQVYSANPVNEDNTVLDGNLTLPDEAQFLFLGGTKLSGEHNTNHARLQFHGSGDNRMEIGCELDNGWGYITNYNNANGIYFYSGGAGDDVVFDAGGAFAIKPYGDEEADLGTGSYRYDDVYATNGTIQTSDKRMKDNIKESSLGLDFINKLKPVQYKWKDYDYTKPAMPGEKGKEEEFGEKVIKRKYSRTHYGLIAQDVEKVLTDMGLTTKDFAPIIYNENDDRYGMRYSELIGVLIKGMQELSAKVKALEGN